MDSTKVPLPNGTKVTTRVDRMVGERRVPQGAVGRVVASHHRTDEVDVELASGDVVRFLRGDLVPTKLGQLRYAVRRERAWEALRDAVILETVVGSRAWGLSDAESDTDRRGVFVLPFPWTIALVEPPSDLVSADGSDTYWAIDKTIRQALRADPNTLETLFLPGAAPVDPSSTPSARASSSPSTASCSITSRCSTSSCPSSRSLSTTSPTPSTPRLSWAPCRA